MGLRRCERGAGDATRPAATQALNRANAILSQLARVLGIARTTLASRLEAIGLRGSKPTESRRQGQEMPGGTMTTCGNVASFAGSGTNEYVPG